MLKFTQGQWTANPLNDSGTQWLIMADKGTPQEKIIALTHGAFDVIPVTNNERAPSQSECVVNARLLAAAPEMFKLLDDFLNPKLHARSKDYYELLEHTATVLNRIVGKNNN